MIQAVIERVKQQLKDHPKRLLHTMGVYETALILADCYGIAHQDVAIPALMHDYYKYDQAAWERLIPKNEYIGHQNFPVAYHALASYYDVKYTYPFLKEESCLAIKNHVFGRANMSMIEKIVFVSDYIEPSRAFENREALFNIAKIDIDQAILFCISMSIAHLKEENKVLHPLQKETYHYYKEIIRER